MLISNTTQAFTIPSLAANSRIHNKQISWIDLLLDFTQPWIIYAKERKGRIVLQSVRLIRISATILSGQGQDGWQLVRFKISLDGLDLLYWCGVKPFVYDNELEV
jgi:hypothetical protein